MKTTLILIGIVLSLLFGMLSMRHNLGSDGKVFYVGSRLLVEGKNAYSMDQLRLASPRFGVKGDLANSEQAQLHLPATLIIFAVLSWMPWQLFRLFLVILNSLCIPLIATICLSYLTPQPSRKAVCVGSLGIALFPATWQNFALDQLGLLTTCCALLTAWCFTRQRHKELSLFAFLSLLKFTCTLPLLCWLLLQGQRQQRAALLVALGLFLTLNAIGAWRTGPQNIQREYRRAQQVFFSEGSSNDPRQGWRIDVQSLTALAPGKQASFILTLLVSGALILAFWWNRTQHPELDLTQISALSAMALLLFYHRTYDATLLLPACFLAYGRLADRRPSKADWLLALFAALSIAALGNHNLLNLLLMPLHRVQPTYFRALMVLLLLCTLLYGRQSYTPERGQSSCPA